MILKSLAPILMPKLDIIGKAAAGTVGRAFLGGSGPAATANVQENPQDNIDWNYLLNRE